MKTKTTLLGVILLSFCYANIQASENKSARHTDELTMQSKDHMAEFNDNKQPKRRVSTQKPKNIVSTRVPCVETCDNSPQKRAASIASSYNWDPNNIESIVARKMKLDRRREEIEQAFIWNKIKLNRSVTNLFPGLMNHPDGKSPELQRLQQEQADLTSVVEMLIDQGRGEELISICLQMNPPNK